MSETIDPEVLEKYVNTVCRLGRAEAAYWFVGLEEGGKISCAKLSKRLYRWKNDGFPDTRYLKNGGSPKSDPVYKYLPGIGNRAHVQMTRSNQLRLV